MATDSTEVRTKPARPEDLADVEEPFTDGFNWNTIMAMLFIGIVMMPGAIYLGLVAGQGMGGAAEWVTIILFLEITKRSFITLKRQELILIYWSASMLVSVAGSGLSGGIFAGLIWNQFFVQSPQAEAIAAYIPTWYAPPKGSAALLERTFMDAVWIQPVAVVVISTILFQIVSLSLGYVIFRITSDIEHLPFPMAPVAAGGATALAETSTKSETWRWRIFSIGTVIGLIWGTIYVVIPTLSGTFLTQAVAILPIPFLDFTVNLRSLLPTAVLAISTDMSTLLAGFVFPYWTVIGMFIGSMVKNFVVNPMLYNYGILHRWEPGMSLIPTTIAVEFDYWLSAKIGMAVAVFVISFYAVIRKLITGKDKISERPTDNLDPEKVGPGSGRG
ncbi:MAG TPA: peptide transporter, partial [Candidatus Latescibacteria bacterium]|nr:peptide transporter [Candidatus Latescibacterota bacterium]